MANKTMHHVIIGDDTYEIVDQYAREHGAEIDATLTQSGKAADAKAVGDALKNVSGVPSSVRTAMLTLFQKAAYIEEGLADEVAVVQSWASAVTAVTLSASAISINGATTSQLIATTSPAGGIVTWESSNLAVATVSSTGLVTGVGNGTCTITARSGDVSATCTATVSGFATLTGIDAVYTQSGTVYDTASLDDLKADLVVTASYDNGTTATITNYTLSGTLAEGTSTITVSYGDKTDTFTVTVTSLTTVVPVTWSGSGPVYTTPIIDARNAPIYMTFPYVEGYSGYASGATAESDFVHERATLYETEDAETPVGHWFIDTKTIESNARTDLNCPSLPVDTETMVAPAGYYVMLTVMKRTTGFSSNANCTAFLRDYVTSVKLIAGGN